MKLSLVLCVTSIALCGVDAAVRLRRAPQNGGEDPLEGLRRNIPGEPGKDYPIYSTNILCKLNPGNPGCGGGRRGGGGGRNNGGGNNGGGNNGGGNGGQQPRGDRSSYQDQIANGQIPGTPGKDFPNQSVSGLRKKNPGKYKNLAVAPAHLITPDYPAGASSGSFGGAPRGSAQQQQNNFNQPRPNVQPQQQQQQQQQQTFQQNVPQQQNVQQQGVSNPSQCPGGSYQACSNVCPNTSPRVFEACDASCQYRCG